MPSGVTAKARTWTAARPREWQQRYEARVKALEGPRAAKRPVGDRRKYTVAYLDVSLRPSPVMVWTTEQAGRFLDHRPYALFHLVVFRGLRRGEVCGMRSADIDMATRRITVLSERIHFGRTVTDSEVKSDASDPVLAFDKTAAAVLRSWRKAQLAERLAMGEAWQDTGYVFTIEDGAPYDPERVTDIFTWEAFRAGLPPIRLHDLRHAAASIAHAAGADIKDIQTLMRHSSRVITPDLYTSVFEDQAADLAEQMTNIVPRLRAVGELDED